jgi:hypothetical protein
VADTFHRNYDCVVMSRAVVCVCVCVDPVERLFILARILSDLSVGILTGVN